jgi:hypothetical protein
VDDASLVDVSDNSGQPHRQAKEVPDGHRRAHELLERSAWEVLELKRRPPREGREGERLDDGQARERTPHLVFLPQPLEVLRAAVLRLEDLEEDRASIGGTHGVMDGRPVPRLEPSAQRIRLMLWFHCPPDTPKVIRLLPPLRG